MTVILLLKLSTLFLFSFMIFHLTQRAYVVSMGKSSPRLLSMRWPTVISSGSAFRIWLKLDENLLIPHLSQPDR